MNDPPSDQEAMLAARSRASAFTVVFERHFAAIHGYLRRRAGKDLADELAAETFAQAFDGRARYDAERADVRPWLFGIAVNLLRRHQRQEERQLRAFARSGVDPVAEPLDGIATRLDAKARAPELAAALAELDPGDRDVLLLIAWAELNYAQVAQALELPLGTVRSRLHRARSQLRAQLEVSRAELANGVPQSKERVDG